MSEYQVIARKWRPQRFSDVVGQEHIVQTLKNAIRMQKTAHAYLFVGPRGVGKTTTARIFAKALNCLAPEDGEPCCKCRSCLAVAAGNNIDVIEIDAASQSSVNDARAIRDEAMHVPVNGRYKVYIIDEVHMLSKQAWNALLKIVEEPPAHIKFIFATTEVHMVLGTIISRCQRFDLQRIPSRVITERLEQICEAENVSITREAILAISRAADGGMRDAQSLLDQMIAFFSATDGSAITEEQVLSLFGLSGVGEIDNLIAAMCENSRGRVVESVFNLASRGKNLETLFSDVLGRLRGIQLCYLIENPEQILETDSESVAEMRKICHTTNPEIIQILLEQLSPVGRALHDALNKQVFLESIFLKAMREAHAVKIEHLIARLNQLRGAGELRFVEQLPAPRTPEKITIDAPAPPVSVPAPATKPEPKPQPVPVIPEIKEKTPAAIPEPIEISEPEPEIIEPTTEPEPPVQEQPPAPPVSIPTPEPTPEPPAVEPPAVRKTAPDPVPEKTSDAETLWLQIIQEAANGSSKELISAMKQCQPVTYENSILTLMFEGQNGPAWLLLSDNAGFFMEIIQRLTGDWMSCVELNNHFEETDQSPRHRESLMMNQQAMQQANENELVKTIIDLFGGSVAEIKK
jgi:DNA polymerase-3 subunit gamma/tau